VSVIGSFTAANKVYHGATAATTAIRSLSGANGGDVASLSGSTTTFSSANVGTWTVTGTSFTLTGAAACNYSLASSNVATTAS
jgi:YDG domain